MEDDLARAEHYTTLANSMILTARMEADERRRAELLHIATQYASLADNLLRRLDGFDY